MDLRSVVSEAEQLEKTYLAGLRIGTLHGRMPSSRKEEIIAAFASGDLDVLVSTTVVEVGVDVPNASVMIIENAERFGLSQLISCGQGRQQQAELLHSRLERGSSETKRGSKL